MVVRVLVVALLQEDEARLVRLPREGGDGRAGGRGQAEQPGGTERQPAKKKDRAALEAGPRVFSRGEARGGG